MRFKCCRYCGNSYKPVKEHGEHMLLCRQCDVYSSIGRSEYHLLMITQYHMTNGVIDAASAPAWLSPSIQYLAERQLLK